ncbi:MAG TPA: Ig-like domain repeat protein [Bryobacterales bacterium]|nr:Ig-like domain repeat protein [Bryobacterales bacterium]
MAPLAANLASPDAVAIDPNNSGVYYIAVGAQHRIFKVAAGQLTAFAGNGGPGLSADGIAAVDANLNNPVGVAVAPVTAGGLTAGDVLIADSRNFRIFKVAAGTGVITTLVDLSGTMEELVAVAVDNNGKVYIADQGNNSSFGAVYLWDNGSLSTLVASSSGVLNRPAGIATDSAGANIYVANTGVNEVCKVSGGSCARIAGTSTPGFSGDGGSPASAMLWGPSGLAVDGSGNVYIADSVNNRIRVITNCATSCTMINTVAGNGTAGFSGDGTQATLAEINSPAGVAVDGSGNFYIADSANDRIREVTGGIINTVAGNADGTFSGDGGQATNASLNAPVAVTVDSSNNLYIADQLNGAVRAITPVGIISTLAGGPNAVLGSLTAPAGLAFNAAGDLLISDSILFAGSSLGVLWKVSAGAITDFADYNTTGLFNLATPTGLAFDGPGNLYVADPGSHAVYKVAPDGLSATTFIGSGLSTPTGLAYDSTHNILYIADMGTMATPGTVFKFDGIALSSFTGDSLVAPSGLRLAGGNLYVADQGGNIVKKYDSNGTLLATVAGTGTFGFSGDGGLATAAELAFPADVALDGAGNFFIADESNNRIRKVATSVSCTPPTFSGKSASVPYGAASAMLGGTINAAATGTVGITVGSTTETATVSSGGFSTSFPTGSLALGSYAISYSYSGDGTFCKANDNTQTLMVTQASTSTTILANPTSSVFGQQVTLTATVSAVAPGSGTPTGSVQFFDGGTLLGSGTLNAMNPDTASFNVSTLSLGAHSNITAHYVGDTNFGASTSALPASVTVGQASTSTALLANPTSAAFGQTVTLTATVTVTAPGSDAPTGMVQFFDGGTSLGTGTLNAGHPDTASLNVSSLSLGTHSNLTAKYVGDADFSGSTSAPASVTIGQGSTATALAVSPGSQQYSDPVTLTATVTVVLGAGIPTGTVSFYDGANLLGTVALNLGNPNTTSLTVTNLSLGAHNNITAQYAGDVFFTGSVSPAKGVAITPEDAIAVYTGGLSASTISQNMNTGIVTLSASVQEKNDDATVGDITKATVTFLDVTNPGSPVIIATVPVGLVNTGDTSTGAATFNWPLVNPGTYKVRASVGGYYTGAAPDVTVTVSQPGNDFVTGSGSLTLQDPAGLAAGAANSTASFLYSAKFNGQANRVLAGSFSLTYQNGSASYQISGTSLTSLAVNGNAATLNGTVTVQDLTHNVTLDSNATFQLDMTSSTIGITVWDSAGGLWFSSYWNPATLTTVQQAPNPGAKLFIH